MEFPAAAPGNVLRGALGHALRAAASPEDYTRIFSPQAVPGPSGLSQPPRPFVIRAAALAGRTVAPGEPFCFQLHLFDTRDSALEAITRAWQTWADAVTVERSRVSIHLDAAAQSASRIRVDFQTPTALKNSDTPEFGVLLARIRDRLSTLRSRYGPGPLAIDFRALGDRAARVRMLRSQLSNVGIQRRSSRTGQRHGIGGFVGFAEYEGDLAEFLPYLQAAYWTGVGRHCAWGNGVITVKILAA